METVHRNPRVTIPETNSKFAPENGWLEDDPFLLAFRPIFRGENVSFREGTPHTSHICQRFPPKK